MPIYKAMKINDNFTKDNLYHLLEFSHFVDEFNEQLSCKHNLKCKSFKVI